MAKFVLIDDSKVARSFLRNVLEEAGHEIVGEGVNGQEGLELYNSLKPDIITLDVVMPIMTGMDCLQEIIKSDPAAKVIMITSVGKDSLIQKAKEMGAKAMIVKPINEEYVMEIVNSLLG